MSARSWLYWLARLLGDVNAVEKGPTAIAKRVKRRIIGRIAGRIIGRL
jgi:hypothetical protein